jgi:putative endonuclease
MWPLFEMRLHLRSLPRKADDNRTNMPRSLTNAWLEFQRSSLAGLDQVAQRIRPRHVKAPHLLIGERGEFEALFCLRRQGYFVVERRWRSPDLNGDLDLIAWDADQLCVIEVKTRSARDLTPAASSIDEHKRNTLRKMARAYRRTLPGGDTAIPIRFDVVSVYLSGKRPVCELLRGAFLLHPEARRNEENAYGV